MSYKAAEENIKVVETLNFEAPKTKEYIELLKNLQLVDKKTLLVLSEPNKAVYLSARNLKGNNVSIVSELNTYNILNAKSLILTEDSVAKIDELFKA